MSPFRTAFRIAKALGDEWMLTLLNAMDEHRLTIAERDVIEDYISRKEIENGKV